MQLTLFDLDNTLLPIDSDVSWAQFLVDLKVVTFQLAPLAQHPREQLLAWREQFVRDVIRPNLQPQAKDLVRQHQDSGDLCAIVTATNSFITGPIAREFGIEHLIATEVEIAPDGNFTGRPTGLPSFREGKITRVEQWLAMQGLGLSDFPVSIFYSDSFNDLPLLARVTVPIAVNPDQRLLAHAQQQGWQVLNLFDRLDSTDD